MVIGIDPKVDFAFKRVFGVEHNRDILADLIDAVRQPLSQQRLSELELLNPFNVKETAEDKLFILLSTPADQLLDMS